MRAMNLLFCLACACLTWGWSGAAIAQDESPYPDVTYPQLPASGAAIADFVPKGWRVEQQPEGDLDKDGRDDVVLVLRMDDPANIVENEGLGPERFDTNPRLLAVLLADGAGYRLALQDHSLIPRPDNPVMDDYLGGDGVSVRRGAFTVALHSWASAGTWYTSSTTFTFRHQDGCFRLIGHDYDGMHRGSGETWNTSLNFAAGKAVFEHGSMASDVPLERKTQAVPRRAMPCLQDIGNGFDYDSGVKSPF